jgi:hypothetical protein
MRKKTLTALCAILAYAIVFTLPLAGVRIPLGLSPMFAGLVLVPCLLVPLTFMNRRLLVWRKARGRDIEEEEKHEDDATGIISLRPRE